jgi:hypothetical protein
MAQALDCRLSAIALSLGAAMPRLHVVMLGPDGQVGRCGPPRLSLCIADRQLVQTSRGYGNALLRPMPSGLLSF